MTTEPIYVPPGFPTYLATVRALLAARRIVLNRSHEGEVFACYRSGLTPAQCAQRFRRSPGPAPG
jgi:hypothetical protein